MIAMSCYWGFSIVMLICWVSTKLSHHPWNIQTCSLRYPLIDSIHFNSTCSTYFNPISHQTSPKCFDQICLKCFHLTSTNLFREYPKFITYHIHYAFRSFNWIYPSFDLLRSCWSTFAVSAWVLVLAFRFPASFAPWWFWLRLCWCFLLLRYWWSCRTTPCWSRPTFDLT